MAYVKRKPNPYVPGRIRTAMDRRGIGSWRTLAKMAGVDPKTMDGILSYQWAAQTKTLQKIADALGTTVQWLTNGKETCTREEQPCWSCKNAVPDLEGHGCSWSRSLIPIEGWRAERSKKKMTPTETLDTWKIIQCPKYEPED